MPRIAPPVEAKMNFCTPARRLAFKTFSVPCIDREVEDRVADGLHDTRVGSQMHNNLDAAHGPADRFRVEDVALNQFDVKRADVLAATQTEIVEDAYPGAELRQSTHEIDANEPAAARD